MLITSYAPRLAAPQPPSNPSNSPAPSRDHVELSAFGRQAASIGGGLAGAAGLGYLGARAGANAGLLVGMELTPANAGLLELTVRAMQGAAWGELIGAACCGAAGAALGVAGAQWLYDKSHA